MDMKVAATSYFVDSSHGSRFIVTFMIILSNFPKTFCEPHICK